MKKLLLRILCIFHFIIIPFFMTRLFADPQGLQPPGTPPGTGHGGYSGAGTPIEDGIGILLVLGMAYILFKIYEIWKKKASLKEEEKLSKSQKEFKHDASFKYY
jgi:hypothetical protein